MRRGRAGKRTLEGLGTLRRKEGPRLKGLCRGCVVLSRYYEQAVESGWEVSGKRSDLTLAFSGRTCPHSLASLQPLLPYAALTLGCQGLVVKRMDSRYLVGNKSRKSGSWIKLKPDYTDDIRHMDLIVLGGLMRQGETWSGYPSR